MRETAELEFKATLDGKTPGGKIELCKDIAGIRNHRGGVIVLGIGEKDAVANGYPEVALSDAEERRMRQIVASGTAPHAAVEIRAVPGNTASDCGREGMRTSVRMGLGPYRPGRDLEAAIERGDLEMAAARSLDRSRFRQSKTGDQANTPGLRPIGYRALHEFFLLRARCAGR